MIVFRTYQSYCDYIKSYYERYPDTDRSILCIYPDHGPWIVTEHYLGNSTMLGCFPKLEHACQFGDAYDYTGFDEEKNIPYYDESDQ